MLKNAGIIYQGLPTSISGSEASYVCLLK